MPLSWRNSLKGKLTALTLGVTMGVLILASVALYFSQRSTLRNQKAIDLGILSSTLASNLSASVAFKDKGSAEEILRALRSAPTVRRAWVLIGEDKIFAEFKSDIAGIAPRIKIPEEQLTDTAISSPTIDVVQPIVLDGEEIGKLRISATLEDINERLLTFVTWLLVITLGGGLIAAVFTMRLQSVVSSPIVALSKLTQRVTAYRDYALRAPAGGNDEVGQLISSLNEMLVEIQVRDQQLIEARDQLEERVEQRTAQLSAEMLERKQAQEALQREQEQLRTLIKHAPVAIAMLDTKLNYIVHSDRWMSDFELPGTSVIASNHLETIPEIPSSWRDAYALVLTGKPQFQPEDKLVLASGKAVHVRWTAQPWYRPTGEMGGILKVVIVINELIEAREAALRSMKVRTEFLTNISHELRTPLNGIVGFAKLLMDQNLEAGLRDEYIQIISYSGELLSNLINTVLDFSKIESKKISLEKIEFDPRVVITHCVDLFRGNAKLKQLDLQLNLAPDLPRLLVGDPTRIQQILGNLIANATKFTEAGTVLISGSVAARSGSTYSLKVSVKDTGIGIAPDKIKSVFDDFTQADGSITRRFGGTGLGLTIVKALVQLMSGEVNVTSIQGKGSEFEIILPLHEPVHSSATDYVSGDTGCATTDRPSLNILVAEDNKINQKLIQAVLKRKGHNVKVVDNGRAAVRAVEVDQFDIVLMDLQMPEMSGTDAAISIRAFEAKNSDNRRRLPIIALTAHAFAEDRDRCWAAGMDDYLTKPLDTKQLFETLARLCQK